MLTLDFLLLVLFFYTSRFSVKLHYIFIFQLDLIQMFTKPIITVNGTHNFSKVMNTFKRCVFVILAFSPYLVLIYNLMGDYLVLESSQLSSLSCQTGVVVIKDAP